MKKFSEKKLSKLEKLQSLAAKLCKKLKKYSLRILASFYTFVLRARICNYISYRFTHAIQKYTKFANFAGL